MGTLWIPGAERIAPSLPGGVITSTAPPRAVWHSTQNPSGDPRQWDNVIGSLRTKNAEPQVLYDPSTDRLGQFIPLNLSGRALRNDGSSRTNRVGRVCIQIEVVAYAEKPFTKYWKPGPNFRALMAALRSWGIADVWPAGPPPVFIASPPHNVPENERSRAVWLTKGGHYSHSQIPGNDHGDPGGISVSKLFAAAAKPPTGDTPIPPKENDMPLTEAEWTRLTKIVQSYSAFEAKHVDQVEATTAGDVDTVLKDDFASIKAGISALSTQVATLQAKVDSLPKV